MGENHTGYLAVSILFRNLESSPLDEEREIQGQVHPGLQNQSEDFVSLWWVAVLDLGLSPSQLLPSYVSKARYGRASSVLILNLGEKYLPCKALEIK